MDTQIASDLLKLCASRSYSLSDIRMLLSRGCESSVTDDVSYLLLIHLGQEFSWTTHREEIEDALNKTDATRLAMGMIQQGLTETSKAIQVFANLLFFPEMDARTSHLLCNILHLLDVDAFVDRIFDHAEEAVRRQMKDRLRTASFVSKRTRLRICRNVVNDLRLAMDEN